MNPEKKRNFVQEIQMENSKLKAENPVRYGIIFFVICELRFANESMKITAAFQEGAYISSHIAIFLLFNLCIAFAIYACNLLSHKFVQTFVRINCFMNRLLQM